MIKIKNIKKMFGDFTAVEDISLQINPGETYGFLGPNGAGKTTTLLMILGIYKPTAGEVRIFGHRIDEKPFEIKRKIGVVAEYQSYYDEMSAWEYLMFFGKLFEVENAEKYAQELLERVNLWRFKDVLLGGFSTGMQRKLGFVKALLHSPDILILDEPVSGLDPFGIVQVREMLNAEHEAGTTILISSHILSEVERTADRVGIIASGRLLAEDNMDNLKHMVRGTRQIELNLFQPDEQLIQQISQLTFISKVEQHNEHLIIHTLSEKDYSADLGKFLATQGAIIQGMRAIETSLEDAFITITEKHIREWASDDQRGDDKND